MKKVYLLGIILLFPFCMQTIQSDELEDALLAKMDTIFEHIDRNRIETGLLSDYGCFFIDPSLYDGVLDDDNWVTLDDWQMLYSSMYASQVNDKVSLEEPSSVFDRSAIAFSLLYLQYNEIDTTAFDRGLLSVVNDQLYESGNESPYLTKELFAMSLSECVRDGDFRFWFPAENYFSNVDEMPMLSVRFDDENYRNVRWGMRFRNSLSEGEHKIFVRITFDDGRKLESHAKIFVKSSSSRIDSREQIDDSIKIASNANHDGGMVQIKYAKFNTTGKLIRPLIVADEMDLSPYGLGSDVDLLSLLESLPDEIRNLFDLVYVNNNSGLDDIFRNASLFQEALQEINNRRYMLHDQSYVVGLGMGGLVASYALSNMEQQGKAHDVQKFITINSPHKGLNLPLGLQAILQHLRGLRFFFKSVCPESIKRVAEVLDQKAMQQMLVYSIDRSLGYRDEHARFMQQYEGMGLPVQCETVAMSNGSLQGDLLYPDSQEMFFELIQDIKDCIDLRITSKLLKHKSKVHLYNGYLRFHFKVWFISVSIHLKEKNLHSTDAMLGLDTAPGSCFPIDDLSLDEMDGFDLGTAFKVGKFCFIPTVSALGINNWEERLRAGLNLGNENSDFDRLYGDTGNGEYANFMDCKDALLYELSPRLVGDTSSLLNQRGFSLENVPSILPLSWTFANNHFKVASQSGTNAVITPLHFNASDEMNVSVSIPSLGVELPLLASSITSQALYVQGDGYISSLENRYELVPMPENVTVDWRVSEGLVIDEEGNDYAIAHSEGARDSLWIEATVTTQYGTETVIRKELSSKNITSITMVQYEEPWYEDYRKHYAFRVDYEPKDIPIDQLTFCWENDVQIEVPQDDDPWHISVPSAIVGLAELETEGDVGMCFLKFYKRVDLVNDSLRRPPVVIGGGSPGISLASNDDPVPIDPTYPKILPTGVNYCEVIMPAIDSDERASGKIRCMVSDHNGVVLSAACDTWVEWSVVYHTSPNPADTELVVTQEATNGSTVVSASSMEPDEVTLQLYNDFGMVRREMVDWSSGEARMSTADLPEGTYYLHILKGDKVIGRKIVFIEH